MGQKNQATSWDKKVTQPLGTNKYHATSGGKKSRNLWDEKILQPVGTTKKNHAIPWVKKNHKTYHDNLSEQNKSCTLSQFLSGHFDFVTVYLGLVFFCLPTHIIND